VSPAIDIADVVFGYAGGAGRVLDGVSIDVRPGERLGVLGPNGGGKSTLLKIIMGLETPASGSVRVLGEDPASARRSGAVGYLAQRVTADLHFPLGVERVVAQPLAVNVPWWKAEPTSVRTSARDALDLVGIVDLAERPIGALSGGQLQRVMIARAIVTRPSILLLDEPTVGIDVEGQRRFGDMIERLRSELGLTIVTVSHDLRTVAATSDRVACLRRTLHYHAAPEGLTPEVLREVFMHDVEAVFGDGGTHAHSAHSHADGGGCAHA
jgi:zinc transport system ATP-binding protein